MSSVYFAQAGEDGPVKIGFCASNPLKRLAELQTGCPHEIFLIGTVSGGRKDESEMHRRLDAYWIRGEWFERKPEVLAAINSVLEAGRIERAIPPPAERTAKIPSHPVAIFRHRSDPPLSQVEFGAMVGVEGHTVYRWENRMSMPRPRRWAILARLTGAPIGEILTASRRLQSEDAA